MFSSLSKETEPMTATLETTPMKPVVIFSALPPRESEDVATIQATEDQAHRTIYRAAEIEAGLRIR